MLATKMSNSFITSDAKKITKQERNTKNKNKISVKKNFSWNLMFRIFTCTLFVLIK